MTTYAYVRKEFPVETVKQLQVLALYDCQMIFIEGCELSQEKELMKLLSVLNEKDVVVLYSLSVFGKTQPELIPIISLFFHQNVRLVCLDDQIDSEKQSRFYQQLLTFAYFEKKMQRLKKYMKKSGHYGDLPEDFEWGRPTIQAQKIQKIQFLYENQKNTFREIAAECDVSLGTVHKYVKELKEKKEVEG